jgi:hypothetical protein
MPIFVLIRVSRTIFARPLGVRITRGVHPLSFATGGLVGASVTLAVLDTFAGRVAGSLCAVIV